MQLKKILSGIVACSLFGTMVGVSYAVPVQVEQSAYERSFKINKEDYTAYVTYDEITEIFDIEVKDKETQQVIFKENNISIETVLSYLEKSKKGKRQKRVVPLVIPVAIGVGELVTTVGTLAAGYVSFKMDESRGPVGRANRKEQGREMNTKQRSNSNWQSRSNKDPNRDMKKHTPSPKHKGGKK